MDQIQDQIDPEVAQEMITLLNKKITNLRNENAQLQVRSSRLPRNHRTMYDGVILSPTERFEQIIRQGGRQPLRSLGR